MQDVHETTQEALFRRKTVRRGCLQQREQTGDLPGKVRVPRNRARYQLLLCRFVRNLTGYKRGIEIQNSPAARGAIYWYAIMHLARVHHNYVTSFRFDLTDHAPRSLRARCHDSDAILIMRVARKGVVGIQRHRLNSGNAGSMVLYAMHPIDHDYPLFLRSLPALTAAASFQVLPANGVDRRLWRFACHASQCRPLYKPTCRHAKNQPQKRGRFEKY
jgi:hypothetical protein